LTDVTIPVIWRDGFESALPLKYEIHESVELKYLFTDLLYKKSAALMRMFSTAYGDANFNAGVAVIFI
jgi:aminopeptidase N